jgi:hypothetical protein
LKETDDILAVLISSLMMFDIAEAAERIGIRPNSIRHGEGNLGGVLGEVAMMEAYPGSRYSEDIYNSDLVIGDKLVEIKTKKCGDFTPHLDYEAGVTAYNATQEADLYLAFQSGRRAANQLSLALRAG